MISKLVLMALAVIMLMTPAGLAQDAEKPTVAILRFGPHLSYSFVDQGLFGGMMNMSVIDEEEHAILITGADLQGEFIDVIRYDANYDFANASFIVEQAIDAGAEVLITYSTPVSQSASFITSDMEDPPTVIFTSVFNPFVAGIADAACVKPDHVTGVEMATPYEDIVPLLVTQNPDIQVIGLLYSTSEVSGMEGARRIAEVAESLSLEVLDAGVARAADLALAAEGVVENGAEALIIPADMLTVSAMPLIMQVATENQLPVFHANAFAYSDGATISAGATRPATQGRLIAAMLAGRLDGSLDIARTGIATISGLVVNLNLDSAEAQGIAIADALQDMASNAIDDGILLNKAMIQRYRDFGLDDDTINLLMRWQSSMIGARADEVEVPPHIQKVISKVMRAGPPVADTGALLESLHCSDEMIAEQQAALDATDQ